jgi:hypothetical protein
MRDVVDEVKNIFILEGDYKRIKNILNKDGDYYTLEEINLMQFLMQRQRKTTKNEGKI